MIIMTPRLKELMEELKKTNSETYYHSLRTKRLAYEMVVLSNTKKYTGYSSDEIDFICKGAMLHDLGKLNVKNVILTKECRLTDEEMKAIKKHPEAGWSLIKDEIKENEMQIISDICLYHHERIDGSGYIGKSDLPFYVQIISVCDVYDALVSDRVYHEGYGKNEALKMIKDGKCGKFDEKIISLIEKVSFKI